VESVVHHGCGTILGKISSSVRKLGDDFSVPYSVIETHCLGITILPTVLQPGGWRVPAALLRLGVRPPAWG
jgi:hypothetical protein